MKITNLEHVNSVSTSDVLGGRGSSKHSSSTRLSKSFSFNVFASLVFIKGNTAGAGADADAVGHNTFSDTYTNAVAIQDVGSSSSSHSIAQVA